MAVNVADDVPARLDDRGAVDEPRGRGLVDDGPVQRELAGGLVPQNEGGLFIGQRRDEVIEDCYQMFIGYQAAAQLGPWTADAAIGEVRGDRRRDGDIKREPWPAQNEHHAVIPNREAVAGAGGA